VTEELLPAVARTAGEALQALIEAGNSWAACMFAQPTERAWDIVPAPAYSWQYWFCSVYGIGVDCVWVASWAARYERWAADPESAIGLIQVQIADDLEWMRPQQRWLDEATPRLPVDEGAQHVIDVATWRWSTFIDRITLLHHLVGRERARLRRVSDLRGF